MREIILRATTLGVSSVSCLKTPNHPGSRTREPLGFVTRQVCTRPHTENRLAIGPNVPATNGNTTEVNHHRLDDSEWTVMDPRGIDLTWAYNSPPRYPTPLVFLFLPIISMMYVAERGDQIFRYSKATDKQMNQNYACASVELGLSNQRPERSMVGHG